IDSLERDYALFIYPARGFNYEGSGPKVRRLAELLYAQRPANMIVSTLRKNLYSGVPWEEILASMKDGAKVYCVFTGREQLKKTLLRIKEVDQGISVMVSGLTDRVREVAAEVGLNPHTINLSLGIQGRTDRIPPPDIRQFTTMCGHGMVSPKLVRDVLRRIKTGKLNFWEGSVILAGPCSCGIYNPYRSAELLKELVPLYTVSRL
ncbi:MAG: hypothetical protein NTY64_17385, partial [Deltaproteobacteria bacterium]|nr:hypothetical protein [Deltaproteobacteria bacterium]